MKTDMSRVKIEEFSICYDLFVFLFFGGEDVVLYVVSRTKVASTYLHHKMFKPKKMLWCGLETV